MTLELDQSSPDVKIKFWDGNHACAEGAIAAGMLAYFGYPITPSSEIAEHLSRKMLSIENGSFMQMEDEIASATACIGAAYAGKKSMTATSGPGFSLMTESIGLGIMTEAPFVVVNVMRASPSTGQPTSVGQADIYQARFGYHGDVEVIVLVPYSSQEMYDLTIRAFNLAEKYRTPVIILADEKIGHLKEAVIVSDLDKLDIEHRAKPSVDKRNYLPFQPDENLIPHIANFGEGYNIFATGLTHNYKGYPDMNTPAHVNLVKRINDKIRNNIEDISDFEEFLLSDADIAIISFGISARCSKEAIELLRSKKVKIGLFRFKTIWPFPDSEIKKLGSRVKKLIVVELNYGQVTREVQRVLGKSDCELFSLAEPQSQPFTIDQITEKVYTIIGKKHE
jgi:2-oxoglutarate ferredoxin oxidoreductase subunit alpha